jgi:opacity protein-like surface antigen
MKRTMILAIVLSVIAAVAISAAYASDYKGEENRGSIFQIFGDFINGSYKVDGKPMKDKGMFQIIADQTKQMELSSIDKQPEKEKTAKP